MKKIQLKLWRDILRQKWQFLALVLIILLGVTSYSAMIGMIDDVIQSLDRTLDELQFQDLLVELEGAPSTDLVQAVAALEGVQEVTGRQVWDSGLVVEEDDLEEGRLVNARLVGMPVGDQPAVNQLYIVEGEYLPSAGGLLAVLDHHVADYYGYEPGTVLHPIVDGERLDVQVVGIGISPEYLMAVESKENPIPSPGGFAVLFMPQATVAQLFGQEGRINELNVRLADRSDEGVSRAREQIRTAVQEAGGTVRAMVERADNPSYNLLMMDLEGGREMMGMVPTMFLTVAALSIYVFLSRMVQTQRPQIGVVKAMGYSKWTVLRHYLFFSAIVALVGAVVGFLLSYPLGLAMSRAYAAEFGLPFVVAQFHFDSALQAIAITLFFCLLAGIFPAWASARMRPAQAIRFDPSVALVTGSIPLLERFLRLFRRLRTTTRIALRNIFRSRRRTLTTALGFIFAFVVLLACWAMFDGIGYMLEIQFQEIDRWDLRASFAQPQMGQVPEQIRGWTGVGRVEAVLEIPVTLESSTATEDAFLTAIDPQTELHGFRLPQGVGPAEALAPGRILISPALGDKLGVETGDEIAVRTAFGSWQLTVDARNDEVMSLGAYVSLPWVQEEAGGISLYNALLLEVEESQWGAVRRQLYQLPDLGSVNLKEDMVASWRSLMGLYYVMMGTFLLFALVISGAVIFNTMTVNVLERWREIATMRALGQDRGRLARMITLENVLIGLLSLLPGLGLGALATYYLFQVFSAGADFYLPFYIAPQSYLIVVGLIFGAALVAQVPAVRRVNRMNLAEATKVMT